MPFSKDGRWPFYGKQYKGLRGVDTTYFGSVIGWLTLETNTVWGDLDGFKKPGWVNPVPPNIYSAGFSNATPKRSLYQKNS